MLNFPASTQFNRRVPKQKFYENIQLSPTVKRAFVQQIKGIYWRNKLAPATLNVAVGEQVAELQVFEISLQSQQLDEGALLAIDRQIPYHILFLLTCNGKVQACIGYKQAQAGKAAFQVTRYYRTPWMVESELFLQPEGRTMDAIYAGFVRQIAGELLQTERAEPLQQAVHRSEQRLRLQKQIESLQNKIRKELQLNRQIQLNAQLKELKQALEELE